METFFNNLHLIQRNGKYIVFNATNTNLICISKNTYRLLTDLQAGMSYEESAIKYSLDIIQIKTLISKLGAKREQVHTSVPIISNVKPVINRITLHVSNDCNLRCKYCYAAGGNYNMPTGMMSLNTAKMFVDFCIRTFSKIDNIVFFGGEPFLNPKAIEYICSTFLQMKKGGRIDYYPKFGAITNGTINTGHTYSLINQYFSFLTISIDGPQEINDQNRVDCNGNGSYDRIVKFIKNVKSISNISIKYEATFTKQHKEKGYTHSLIDHFIYSNFGIKGEVINEQSFELDSNKSNNGKLIDVNLVSDETFMDILSSIVYKKSKTMCALCRDIIAISINGDIYPCHMNVGEENCCLGNIVSNNIFNDQDNYTRVQRGLKKKFKDNPKCNNCWAEKICGGCSRLWFYNPQKQIYNEFPNEYLCESNKEYLEDILYQIVCIRQDKKRWQGFIEKLMSNKKRILSQ